ncbi:hypothetical protein FBU30_007679 [Linnemannia zychae]|nr:hypothetical protein FBU30_007679 [Linnemannia zychae]
MNRFPFNRPQATAQRLYLTRQWQGLPSSAPAPSSGIHISNRFHTSTFQSVHYHKINHYERLGLDENATKKEIKTQFYKLSKLHHPDKNASEASRLEFLAINEAYSVLSDDRRRRDYDLTFRDKSGAMYSNSSSSSTDRSLRGSLRRTPFRHSAQSAAAAAAAKRHGEFRKTFGLGGISGGGGGGGGGRIPHFDSKSHQEMHHEQEIRQEERRQARERTSKEAEWRKKYEDSDGALGKIFRFSFVFISIIVATSFMKVFADEKQKDYRTDKSREQSDQMSEKGIKNSYGISATISELKHHGDDSGDNSTIVADPLY